ncbi:MAG: DNA helicase PcrA [Cellulosilyticaceae bacterium]
MDLITGLNEKQKEAVLQTEGPLLILAGAGSGKTRVLTHRIAHLIQNKKIAPWSILSITFTNKAAAEMRERVGHLVGENLAKDMWISTFHAMCVRILRRNCEQIGYGKYFTIYDTTDQKSLIKEILKQLNINEKNFPPAHMLSAISAEKNQMVTPEDFEKTAGDDYRNKIISKIYAHYQRKLKENDAMDFDDLLLNTCLLFRDHPDVLEFYQNKFRYILVDEYQDTNGVQYQLVQLLAKKFQNLCVVGDDDQSIYGWRGADIRNILDFERDFLNAHVIKLEQNYRSTKTILDAANGVVRKNRGRKEKKLWTDNEDGDVISIIEVDNEYKEADTIAELIIRNIDKGDYEFKDHAILYRTNAQSRVLEEKMIRNDIPYRLLGGTRFYERKEIKDMIAYLRVIANKKDDVALKRIINVPKRGIGNASLEQLRVYAYNQDMDFYEACHLSKEMRILGNGPATKVMSFVYLMESLTAIAQTGDVQQLLEAIIKETDYKNYLKQTEGEDAADRIANMEELVSKAAMFMRQTEEPSLEKFLEDVALVADIDNYDEQSNSIVLMTMHSAKGLEFPVVFIPGMEDGLFPSYMSMTEGDDKVEEERRLCYVGITRAREKLYMLYALQRTVFGKTQSTLRSRFLKEIPVELTNMNKLEKAKAEPLQSSFMMKPRMTQGNTSSGTMRLNTAHTNPLSPFNRQTIGGSIPKSGQTPMEPVYKKIENLPKVEVDFYAGDVIKHKMFGEGTIVQVDKADEDVFVTIEFKKGMTKKLSVRFAKLEKI